MAPGDNIFAFIDVRASAVRGASVNGLPLADLALRMIARINRAASIISVALSLASPVSWAEERYVFQEPAPRQHSFEESALYVGAIYVVSTVGYLLISHDEVFNNATLQNYARNFGNITLFDQDLPSSNWGVHLATGTFLYQFYRARGYGKTDSFLMNLIQECLYQFTVETAIQPTALENIGYTTILGSLIGRGLEVASLPMINSDFFPFRILGHLLNLPTFIAYEGKVKVVPSFDKNTASLAVQVRF